MPDKDDLPNLLMRLWRHLTRRRQAQFGFCLGLMLLSALAEVASLGAVLPFLGVLVAPDRVFSHPFVAEAVRPWGISAAEQLIFPLTVAFVAMALIAGAFRIVLSWFSTRLAFSTGADLSIELYRRTLYQPYQIHTARNSSEVVSAITNKVGIAVGVLSQGLTLVSALILIIAIVISLIFIDPLVAAVSTIAFGGCYGLIAWLSRMWLRRNSLRISLDQTKVIKSLQEGLGGIRDVLLDGTQEVFCDAYRGAERPLRRAQADNAFIGASPRFAMEALGIALIALLAYGLSSTAGGLNAALPVLGALALGAQRLLPAFQQGYAAWAGIAGSKVSLADTLELLDQTTPADELLTAPAPLHFRHDIRLEGVSFRYKGDAPWALRRINLRFLKGARIGVVGSTGSGKSTLLDIIMGLLMPTEGSLLVDEQVISGKQIRAWQRNIAHVPQVIYLTDCTVAENIAFGVRPESIDMQLVRHVSRQAQIADFIEEGPDGYRAHVGERGIRLSGGQRQRIGIARALYKQASVLVFDEATSALDSVTEQSVMDAIEVLGRDLTVLLIAHRLTTVRRCDTIIELDGGRLVAQGTYEQLLEGSATFRKMAEAGGRSGRPGVR